MHFNQAGIRPATVGPVGGRRATALRLVRGGAKKAKKKKKAAAAAALEPAAEEEEAADEATDEVVSKLFEASASLDTSLDASSVALSAAMLAHCGLRDGDVVRVHGARRSVTLARVVEGDDSDDDDSSKGAASLSATVLENAKGGSKVWLTKAPKVGAAGKVELALLTPRDVLDEAVDDDALFEDCIAPYFKGQDRPLRSGGVVTCAFGDDMEIRWRVSGLESADGATIVEALVGADSEIVVSAVDGMEDDAEGAVLTYADLGGCDAQIELLKEVLELPLQQPYVFAAIGVPPPRGVLLTGPAGCGKSALARAAAFESGAHVETISGPELLSKRAGDAEEALRAKFAAAEANAPAIVLIDDIEALGKKRAKASEAERRVCSQLLTLLDGLRASSGVVVLGATAKPNDLDPALRRFGRLDREVELLVPDAEGRRAILAVMTRDMRLAADVDLEAISKDSHGFVGADLAQLCTEAALACVKDGVLTAAAAQAEAEDDECDDEDDEDARYAALAAALATEDAEANPEASILAVKQRHFVVALKSCNPSSLRESVVEVPDVSWSDVGGLENVKRELKETVEYPVQFAHHYDAFGLPPSKGVLFYGPPGCGKTLIAKAVANECGANFISVKGPELLTMWFGESEANVRSLFDKARAAAPCILFFDEMDSIAKARSASASGSDAGDRVMNQILAEIDGVGTKNVFVIGATNRPDILDPAVTRPGRLDQLIHIPLPDFESRRSVFKAALRKAPLDPTMSINKLAKATAGFSGADISEICQRAAKNAVKAAVDAEQVHGKDAPSAIPFILKQHFEESMSRARRSVPQSEIDRYDKYAANMKTSAKKDANSTFSFAKGGFA